MGHESGGKKMTDDELEILWKTQILFYFLFLISGKLNLKAQNFVSNN